MPLDARIPLSVQAPQIASPLSIAKDVTELQGAQQQQQANALKLQQAQREQRAQELLASAYQKYYQNGKLNSAGVAKDLADGGYGDHLPAFFEGQAKIDKSLADAIKAKGEADEHQKNAAGRIGAVADALRKSGKPTAGQEVAAYLMVQLPAIHNAGLMSDDELRFYGSKLVDPSDTDSVNSVVDALLAAPEQTKLAGDRARTAETNVDIATKTAEMPMIPAKIEEAQAKATQASQVAAGMQGGLTAKDRAELALTGQQRAIAAGQLAVAQRRENREASQDTGVSLTPEGLDLAAENFAKTGQLPPMGLGKAGAQVRSAIINRAANLHPGLDLASARAGFGADQGSLKQLQSRRDAISAFENTALKNIDIFLGTAGKIVDTGSPLANSLARAASGKVLGSPNQAAYDAARQVALNEVARITSNPNLTGVLSDSARKEVEAFNPNSATLAQSVAVMRVLKQDMANRAVAYDQQLKEVKDRIKAGSGTTPAVDTNDPLGILK